jgi:predicted MFS family arabinose efflux permease
VKPVPALLALGTFAAGTSELVIAGILPLVADDLGVSIAVAGQLVTAYALGFALGAPVVAAVTGAVARRPLLLALLSLFVAGNALAALAASYGLLLLARVFVAVSAGSFEVAATAVAAALVPPAERGRAIALVVGGFSAALVLGVPLGTLIGQASGWRATFAAVAVLGAVVAAGLARFLPALDPPAAPESSGFARGALFRRPGVLPALLVTGLVFTGQYVVATYLAPFLEQRTGLDGTGVAAMLLLAGAASAVGNVVGGHGADRWGIRPTALAGVVISSLSLVVFSVVGTSPAGAAVSIGIGGLALGTFIPAWQYRLVSLVPDGPDLALALNLSVLNLGIALGAALGGVVVDGGGLAGIGLVGGLAALLALVPLQAERRP